MGIQRAWPFRLARLLILAVVLGLPLSQVIIYTVQFNPVDTSSYIWAGEAWRTTGNPYSLSPEIVGDNPIYRYSPWFALPWIGLSLLPTRVVEVGWVMLMVSCAFIAVIPLFRAYGVTAIPVGGFFLGWLIAIGLNGNVQPAMIALLAWGVTRRWAPLAVAVCASLKAVPLFYILVFIGRREWRKVGWTILITGSLVAPMLLFEVPASSTSTGVSYSLFGVSPILWLVVAGLAAVLAVALARTKVAWIAGGAAVLLALPRTFLYDLTFLMPGLDERSPHPSSEEST
jgi:hypothetical protein